jgi:hypothetical protein
MPAKFARTPCRLLCVRSHVECGGACSRQTSFTRVDWTLGDAAVTAGETRPRHGPFRQAASHTPAAPRCGSRSLRARLRWRARTRLVGELCRTRGGFCSASMEPGRFEDASHDMAVGDELTLSRFFSPTLAILSAELGPFHCLLQSDGCRREGFRWTCKDEGNLERGGECVAPRPGSCA